jgi:hypothetical protein
MIYYGMGSLLLVLFSSYILLLGLRRIKLIEIVLFIIFALIVSNRW